MQLIVISPLISAGQNVTPVELSASCTIHGNILQPVGTLRQGVIQTYFRTNVQM